MDSRSKMALVVRYRVPGTACGTFLQEIFDAGFSAQVVSLQSVALVEIIYDAARLEDYLILRDRLDELVAGNV